MRMTARGSLIALAVLVLGGGDALAEDLGEVLFATKQCALINGPLHYAFVTGSLEVKKGDLIQGPFRFHSYGSLLDASGRVVGVDAYIEDTTPFPSKVLEMVERFRAKCA